jgi:hypothetical protein
MARRSRLKYGGYKEETRAALDAILKEKGAAAKRLDVFTAIQQTNPGVPRYTLWSRINRNIQAKPGVGLVWVERPTQRGKGATVSVPPPPSVSVPQLSSVTLSPTSTTTTPPFATTTLPEVVTTTTSNPSPHADDASFQLVLPDDINRVRRTPTWRRMEEEADFEDELEQPVPENWK